MNAIEIVRGGSFNFFAPAASLRDMEIEQVAYSLSQLCRFTGHTFEFYSVAQHCVLVSELVPVQHGMAGLLHDAHESVCGDVSSPLKAMLPDYQRIEASLMNDFLHRFHDEPSTLPRDAGHLLTVPEDVKVADKQALAIEQERLMPEANRPRWYHEDPAMVKLLTHFEHFDVWPPTIARRRFVDRYYHLIDVGARTRTAAR